ncbi:MAG: hypothetical protein FWC32_10695 [Firmicutes bacterium]|nr:hypothetical protein [Bacillota bacterium]
MKQKITIVALMLVWMLALLGTAYGFVTIHRLRMEAAPQNVNADAQDYEPQATLTAGELFHTIEQNGMYYAIIGDYLFYVNPDNGSHMYRFNLSTYYHQLYLQVPVFGVITNGEVLLVMFGTPPDSAILAVDPVNDYTQIIAIDVDTYKEWRIDDGIIFYWDTSGRERSILPCGRPIVL